MATPTLDALNAASISLLPPAPTNALAMDSPFAPPSSTPTPEPSVAPITTPTPTPEPEQQSGMPLGAIIGIIIAVLALISIITAVLFFVWRRNRLRKEMAIKNRHRSTISTFMDAKRATMAGTPDSMQKHLTSPTPSEMTFKSGDKPLVFQPPPHANAENRKSIHPAALARFSHPLQSSPVSPPPFEVSPAGSKRSSRRSSHSSSNSSKLRKKRPSHLSIETTSSHASVSPTHSIQPTPQHLLRKKRNSTRNSAHSVSTTNSISPAEEISKLYPPSPISPFNPINPFSPLRTPEPVMTKPLVQEVEIALQQYRDAQPRDLIRASSPYIPQSAIQSRFSMFLSPATAQQARPRTVAHTDYLRKALQNRLEKAEQARQAEAKTAAENGQSTSPIPAIPAFPLPPSGTGAAKNVNNRKSVAFVASTAEKSNNRKSMFPTNRQSILPPAPIPTQSTSQPSLKRTPSQLSQVSIPGSTSMPPPDTLSYLKDIEAEREAEKARTYKDRLSEFRFSFQAQAAEVQKRWSQAWSVASSNRDSTRSSWMGGPGGTVVDGGEDGEQDKRRSNMSARSSYFGGWI